MKYDIVVSVAMVAAYLLAIHFLDLNPGVAALSISFGFAVGLGIGMYGRMPRHPRMKP